MKKKITLISVTAITITLLLFNPNDKLIANSGGSVGGFSSSVGDNGNSCGQGGCHGGGHIMDAVGYITTNIPATGYIPGNVYTIQLMGDNRGRAKFGFELSAENNAGATIGTLATSGTGREQLKSNGQITHTNTGNTGANGDFGWEAMWTAPSIGSGDVSFSASVLFANGNGGNSGDSTRISKLTVSEDLTVSLNEINKEIKSLYPNPVINDLTISLETAGNSIARIINREGKLVKQKQFNGKQGVIDFSDLEKGLYVVSIEKNNTSYTRAIIKQ